MNRSKIRNLSDSELKKLSLERKMRRGSRAAVYTEDALYAQEILCERGGIWTNVNRRACVGLVGAYSTNVVCNINDMYSWNDEYVDTRL